MFIAVDGIDGAGKSTQIRLLIDWLEQSGHNVESYRDPGATPLGESVREILLHREDIALAMRSEMLLYMAARSQLVDESIMPALERGSVVVCDRFLLANVVYQGSAGGLNENDLWTIGNIATGGLRPDLQIVLDLDVDRAMQRVGPTKDRLEKRGVKYFEKVRQGFLDNIHRAAPHRLVVDASRSVECVQSDVQNFVSPLLTKF